MNPRIIELMKQALEALEMAQDHWSTYHGLRSKTINDAADTLRAALAEPVQEPPWLRAIDEAMIDHHIGVADSADDYETAKRKLNNLLCHAQDIGAYFAKQAEPVEEPVAWGCFKDGELQVELIGTKTDVDFWVASDEPHMQGMVSGPLYTTLPQRLTAGDNYSDIVSDGGMDPRN